MNRGTTKRKPVVARKPVSKPSRPKKPEPADNPKLAALKRAHFTKKGRAARIAHARRALEEARWDTGLDIETIKWLAEDPDLEYL